MKFCVNCKFLGKTLNGIFMCNAKRISPVNGIVTHGDRCHSERRSLLPQDCGPDGKYYKPKDKIIDFDK